MTIVELQMKIPLANLISKHLLFWYQKLFFFSKILIFFFLFEKIKSKRTLNPELASKKNLEFNNEILPAKNPVNGSETFTDKISFKILLNSLLKKALFDETCVKFFRSLTPITRS